MKITLATYEVQELMLTPVDLKCPTLVSDKDTYDDGWDTWDRCSDDSVSGSREQTSEVSAESEDSVVRSITST